MDAIITFAPCHQRPIAGLFHALREVWSWHHEGYYGAPCGACGLDYCPMEGEHPKLGYAERIEADGTRAGRWLKCSGTWVEIRERTDDAGEWSGQLRIRGRRHAYTSMLGWQIVMALVHMHESCRVGERVLYDTWRPDASIWACDLAPAATG